MGPDPKTSPILRGTFSKSWASMQAFPLLQSPLPKGGVCAIPLPAPPNLKTLFRVPGAPGIGSPGLDENTRTGATGARGSEGLPRPFGRRAKEIAGQVPSLAPAPLP